MSGGKRRGVPHLLAAQPLIWVSDPPVELNYIVDRALRHEKCPPPACAAAAARPNSRPRYEARRVCTGTCSA